MIAKTMMVHQAESGPVMPVIPDDAVNIYNYGDQCTSLTGGWGWSYSEASASTHTATFNSDCITLLCGSATVTRATGIDIGPSLKIDFSSYTKLWAEVSSDVTQHYRNGIYFASSQVTSYRQRIWNPVTESQYHCGFINGQQYQNHWEWNGYTSKGVMEYDLTQISDRSSLYIKVLLYASEYYVSTTNVYRIAVQ